MHRETAGTIRKQLDEIPVVDVHTHLGRNWQARHLADIVSYHWLEVELTRAAGGPFEADPQEDPEGYIREVLPHFPAVRNTSNHYACMHMLTDLYGLKDRTLTEGNWGAVDEAIREKAGDRSWVEEVTNRARIKKVMALPQNVPEPRQRFVPYAYGERFFDIHSPGDIEKLADEHKPVAGDSEQLRGQIQSDIRRTVREQDINALHVWPRESWEYVPTDEDDVEAVLACCSHGQDLSPPRQNQLQSFCADVAADEAARHGLVVQIFHGSADHADSGHASSWHPAFIRSFARHVVRHPDVRYDLFLGTRIPDHETVSVARRHPNLMVSGAWWHAFTPRTMLGFFRDRLEMLPNTAWNAFYSDAYVIEWLYAKLQLTKNRLAHALAGMVEEGFLTRDDVPEIARKVLYENPVKHYRLEG